jgi:hypothetical protein
VHAGYSVNPSRISKVRVNQQHLPLQKGSKKQQLGIWDFLESSLRTNDKIEKRRVLN